MFFSLRYTVGESDTRDAPPCGCLPLSLFDLIAVPLSLLLHFIPLCGALVVLVLALSCYLGCLAPLIYVYGCLSCPTHIICGCPGLFCFCSLVFPLLNPILAMMSSAGYFHARFLMSAFFSFLFFSDRVRPQFVLVLLPLSCDHSWIRSGPVNNVR